jgi:hypothetical protein
MSSDESRTGHDVRMNVKVCRRDFPVLTDEIAGLPKGPRRTGRLAHLATLGLLWERGVAETGATSRALAERPGSGPLHSDRAGQVYRSRLDASHLAALLDGDAEV